MSEDDPLFCAHCLASLTPGAGNFWVISIDAVADPTPPEFTEEDLRRDLRSEFAEVVRQMQDTSPLEAMDQVHRHMVIHLCNRCFETWMDNPAS
jgi:hypothetical protein